MAGKIKTVERDLWFNLNPDGESGESSVTDAMAFIDLAQCASLVNRISLRQGMQYVVESIEFYTNGKLNASVWRLPEHWPLLNAWEKTFHAWKDQQKEAAREAGLESTQARYNDFKIFMNSDHVTAGFGGNLIPSGYTKTAPATGGYGWAASQVVVPNDGGVPGNTVEYHIHAVGDDKTAGTLSKGMILAYAESRSRPFNDDPNIVDVASGGLYGEMEDVGEIQEEVVDNLQQANQQPPYVIDVDTVNEFYPGGVNQGTLAIAPNGFNTELQLEDVISINAGFATGSNFGTASEIVPGFVVPCGLLGIRYHAESLSDTPTGPLTADYFPSLMMRITLAPGHYKGFLAQSMQEAN